MVILGNDNYYIIYDDDLNFNMFYLAKGNTAIINKPYYVFEKTKYAVCKRLFTNYKEGMPLTSLTPKPMSELLKQSQNPENKHA